MDMVSKMEFNVLLSLWSLILAIPIVSTPPSTYIEQDIYIYNCDDGIRLAGTLTIPDSIKPHAAIVLATGSGPQNRDEEWNGHRPFKYLASHLAEHGYAVLRMDDRGIGESQGDSDESSVNDYIRDLNAAIEKLDSCFGKSMCKGIFGHSEGGTAAIRNAVDNPRCGFIITWGAPAWDGDSIVMSQTRARMQAEHGGWENESAQKQKYMLELIKSDMPEGTLLRKLVMIVVPEAKDTIGFSDVPARTFEQLRYMISPPFREIIRNRPESYIKSVTVPWLALNGDKDSQVMPENLRLISKWNPQATTVILKDHNHWMQHCLTGEIKEYDTIAEDISQEMLDIITDWLDRQFHVRISSGQDQ